MRLFLSHVSRVRAVAAAAAAAAANREHTIYVTERQTAISPKPFSFLSAAAVVAVVRNTDIKYARGQCRGVPLNWPF